MNATSARFREGEPCFIVHGLHCVGAEGRHQQDPAVHGSGQPVDPVQDCLRLHASLPEMQLTPPPPCCCICSGAWLNAAQSVFWETRLTPTSLPISCPGLALTGAQWPSPSAPARENPAAGKRTEFVTHGSCRRGISPYSLDRCTEPDPAGLGTTLQVSRACDRGACT